MPMEAYVSFKIINIVSSDSLERWEKKLSENEKTRMKKVNNRMKHLESRIDQLISKYYISILISIFEKKENYQ